ncbi:hypothetical protein [Methylibium sp.]|uniref:hypothetical protein n=1 Tax=Methylibium sp. TaxID=2067992 RepID=UPI0033400610
MTMNPACIAEIQNAVGRPLRKVELDRIQSDLTANVRELARTDPQAFAGMSREQRMVEAGKRAVAAAQNAANQQARRKASNLVAQARESARLAERAVAMRDRGHSVDAFHQAVAERLRNVDDYVSSVRGEIMSQIVFSLRAVEPKFFGFLHDATKSREFAKAVIANGEHPDPVMAKAAKTYLDTMEQVRLRANAAGADIGKLDYGYLPQPHDVGAIARAGADTWAQRVLPLLDRGRYLDDAGQPMADDAALDMLRGAWETLATEGRNKVEPGQFRGTGGRAGRFDDAHRAIHFKDGDAYSDYMAEFGRGSMFDSILGHVGMQAKTIGMMEELGASPPATYRLLKDLAERGDGKPKLIGAFASLDNIFDDLNGTTGQPVSARMAEFWQGARNLTVTAKLQGNLLSAVTDVPMQVIVAKSGGIPLGKALGSLFAGFGSGKARAAERLAIGMDAISGEMARWHLDNMTQGWTSKLANTTMRLGLVEQWTNALRRGYGLTLSGVLHDMKGTAWADIEPRVRNIMANTGVTEADWKLWQAAVDVDGRGMLTKDGIRAIPGISERDANRAVARLLGYIDSEAKTAVLQPDIVTRANLRMGTRAGTPIGEFNRNFMLFKSFPSAILIRHINRLRNIPSGAGKLAYSAAMMSSLTAFGALSLSLVDLASGRDPREPTTAKFWTAAFMRGGGIGIFGDLLYTGMGGNARGGQANWTSALGPVFGTMMDFLNVTLGNAGRLAEGKDVDFGADAVRFARQNTPFVNLWYARAAIDQAFVHDLQEQLSPGYLRKLRDRHRKEFGQEYWWQPGGDFLPERAPDVGSNGE